LEEAPPKFVYSKFAQGVFWITCANELTKAWLIRTVSGLGELREGAELTVVDSKDLLRDLGCWFVFPTPPMSTPF